MPICHNCQKWFFFPFSSLLCRRCQKLDITPQIKKEQSSNFETLQNQTQCVLPKLLEQTKNVTQKTSQSGFQQENRRRKSETKECMIPQITNPLLCSVQNQKEINISQGLMEDITGKQLTRSETNAVSDISEVRMSVFDQIEPQLIMSMCNDEQPLTNSTDCYSSPVSPKNQSSENVIIHNSYYSLIIDILKQRIIHMEQQQIDKRNAVFPYVVQLIGVLEHRLHLLQQQTYQKRIIVTKLVDILQSRIATMLVDSSLSFGQSQQSKNTGFLSLKPKDGLFKAIQSPLEKTETGMAGKQAYTCIILHGGIIAHECLQCNSAMTNKLFNVPVYNADGTFHSFYLSKLFFCTQCQTAYIPDFVVKMIKTTLRAQNNGKEYDVSSTSMVYSAEKNTDFKTQPIAPQGFIDINGSRSSDLISNEFAGRSKQTYLGSQLNSSSFLHNMGYSTSLGQMARRKILVDASRRYGVRSVIDLLSFNIKMRVSQKNGASKYSRAIGIWRSDINYLIREYSHVRIMPLK